MPSSNERADRSKDPRGTRKINIIKYPSSEEQATYADIRRVSVVEYPRVLVRLKICISPFRAHSAVCLRWEEVAKAQTQQLRTAHKHEYRNLGIFDGHNEPLEYARSYSTTSHMSYRRITYEASTES